MPIPAIVVGDEEFVSWFDLDRPELRSAAAKLNAGDAHGAALAAAMAAGAGSLPGKNAVAEWIAATRRAIQRHFPRSIDMELATARWLEADPLPAAGSAPFVEDHVLGIRARCARERGNETLIHALLYATTAEPRWAARAIAAGLKAAAEIKPLPAGGTPPMYGWHPHAPADLQSQDMTHRLNYWMQAWPLLDAALEPEPRLAWLKILIAAARDRLKANRHEIPFNLTLHPLLPPLQIAAAFPALRESSEWLACVLDRIERDFCALPFATGDGYTREGAGYHCVNTRLLTSAYLVLLRNRGIDHPELKRMLLGAYALQALLLVPDGSLWALGDAETISFHEHWQNSHEALQLGAALFNRPEWKVQAGSMGGGEPELLNLWLMGAENIERYAAWPKIDIERRVFPNAHAPQSCFHALRAGRGLSGHAGILAFGSELNHAHHDTGQVLIYGLGRRLISDSGHPGYLPTDMVPGFSTKIHAVVNISRRTPLGPRTDFTEHVRSLGVFESDTLSMAMAEHTLFENHVVRRALALVSPHGRENGEDVFWIVLDRVMWKRGWPAGANEPNELIETVFPFHAPGCKARLAPDGHSAWSLYDGPDGAPYIPGGPARAELREAWQQSDSNANIQITCVPLRDSGASERPGPEWDAMLLEGWTNVQGGKAAPRPMAVFRWRGKLPHYAAYILLPFRGLRADPIEASGSMLSDGRCQVQVHTGAGTIRVELAGFSNGALAGNVSKNGYRV